jgi:Uma2 family endonuclease
MTNSSVSGVLFAELLRLGVDPKLIGVDQPIVKRWRNAPPALVVHSEESAAAMGANPELYLELRSPMPRLVIEIVTGGLIDPEKQRTPTEIHFAECAGEKRLDYFDEGIREYWIVDTRGTSFAVFRRPNGYSESDERYAFTDRLSAVPHIEDDPLEGGGHQSRHRHQETPQGFRLTLNQRDPMSATA